MPGVFAVALDVAVGAAVGEILLPAEYSLEGEWEGRGNYLPLK